MTKLGMIEIKYWDFKKFCINLFLEYHAGITQYSFRIGKFCFPDTNEYEIHFSFLNSRITFRVITF